MLLHAPVKRSAAEAEFAGRQGYVEVVHAQRALDHLLFELVKVEARGVARAGRDGRGLGTAR
jgi:hypothetical protein